MIEKWHTKDGIELTWKETLSAMCENYGTFCGRWHSNEFWATTKSRIPNMSESQCRDEIQQIESQADADLRYWRMMQ